MKDRRILTKWLLVLGVLHVIIACPGFFSPYDPVEQDRRNPYLPPMRLHLVDAQGHFHLRPFVYPSKLREGTFDQYEEDTARTSPLKFFVNGARYRLLGVLPCRLHLFGAENNRIYLLGSDGYGRDQFSRLLFGGQVSLLAGLLGAGLTLLIGLCIGAVAGYYGGWRDEALMRAVELFLALPWLYLLFALRAFLPLAVSPLESFFLIIAVTGTVGWARPARLVRGIVLSAKERDSVRAARGFGASDLYLLRRHILPETTSVLWTQAAILIPQFVLAEMTLSFLGLGVPEPVPSWGNLLSNLQQYSVLVSYWWMYFPALAMVPYFLGYLGLASSLQGRGRGVQDGKEKSWEADVKNRRAMSLWRRILPSLLFFLSVLPCHCAAAPPQQKSVKEELLVLPGEVGRSGGRLVVSLRGEPKTLNPLIAADARSREVIGVMQADLVHINRVTQLTEPALAKSWKTSPDGLAYTLVLRQGIKFSDGQPLDADDVLFTFRVYLDENVHAPQRDLLVVGGKPITVRKIDAHTVLFQLAKTYGVGERLFDGLAILPKHLLEKPYREGKLGQIGTLATAANQWVGLGPFRLKEYIAGQQLVLERNPYYWKTDAKGNRLPYLNELVILFVPNADAQVLKFQSGETDLISQLSAENFSVLSRQQHGYTVVDAGPGLEYNFLFFNLNDPGEKTSPERQRKQKWFREVKFRQAVSAAVDREAIIRLVYQGRGAPLWGLVAPGNRRWGNEKLAHTPRSPDRARTLLKEAGFSWSNAPDGESTLQDSDGKAVEFSILTSSSNADRTKMAALIQDDLKQLGMRVQVVPLEFRSLLDRVMQTKDYDACVMGIVSLDADPNSDINVWLSSGGTHLWNPSQAHPATPWEAEIDRLIEAQMSARTFEQRKKLYDRAQEILAEYQPMIFLASPDILAGAKNSVGNFHPAVLEPYVLWNVEQLYLKSAPENITR